MTQCCGKVCKTLYCPDCGKPQSHNDVDGLLRYVLGMRRRAEGQLEDAESAEFHREWRVEKATERRDKWAGWHKALLKLVKGR